MKEKNIAEELVKQSLRTIDCVEGKITVDELVTFRGSHAIDKSELVNRLSGKATKPKPVAKQQEPAKNKAMGAGTFQNKGA